MPDTSETNSVDTVDEVMGHVEWLKEQEPALGLTATGERMVVLADEIERLREVVADHEDKARQLGESIAWLYQEKERLEKLLSEERSLSAAAAQHTTALERKVAELQENASATLYHEALRMKRELEWYARRDLCRLDIVKAYYGANIDETDVLEAIDALIEWEKTNPKPGAAT